MNSSRVLPVLLLLLVQACCPAVECKGEASHFECLIHSDYQQLPRPSGSPSRSSFLSRFESILGGWLSGVGDRHWVRLDQGESGGVKLHEWSQRHGAPVNAHAMWLTRDWDGTWVSKSELRRMAESGVTPVLILYYFAEDISRSFVLKKRMDWYLYLIKVAMLVAIDQPVLLVIEPEFNDATNSEDTLITDWTGFNEVVIDGIYLLRSLAPNVLVGICPGDFGEQNREPAIGEIVAYSDFIAFQEMRASTRPSKIKDTYEDVTPDALTYAGRLHETFGKPVLLAYVAVSTHDPKDGRWEHYQADVITNLFAAHEQFVEAGVFGILYFMLFDDPEHVGYFGPAETGFGLVDRSGNAKPGWEAFKTGIRELERQGVLVRVK